MTRAGLRRTLAAVGRRLPALLALALLGAFAGAVVAIFSPARLEIAGSAARIWVVPGQHYDQLGVSGIVTARVATGRSVLGEVIGVRGELDFDVSQLVSAKGSFDTDVLPAYIQAYSDPHQLITDVRKAIIVHFLVYALLGVAVAWAVYGSWRGYRAWRTSYDRAHWPDRGAVARDYRAPERAFTRRAAIGVVGLVLLAFIPSGRFSPPRPQHVEGDPALAGTPFADVEVTGLLRPAIVAVRNYIETYFEQTNKYYDQLRDAVDAYLAANPVTLPSGDDVAQVGFVSDRHCNIGMDRVVVDVLHTFKVPTLVSGGDDAFSGSFSFEAACTRNIANKSGDNHITDVFVGGNHDSPMTIADEKKQGIKTLTDGKVVDADGLHFVGLPDPRTSRYGQGIVPSDNAAQARLLTQQGRAIGQEGCDTGAPVIAVAHDPLAGTTALQNGCGHITLALDGHTHAQGQPTPVTLQGGGTGYQLTSGSTGGAPGEGAVEATFASRLTVGPLNHEAWMSIVSIDRSTGALVGVTEFHFQPDQTVSVVQRTVPQPQR